MNKQRRKQITELIEQLESLKSQIEEIDIDSIRSEEQDYRDNMPENLQNSEKAYNVDEAISQLEDADSCLGGAVSSIEDIISELENAKDH